MQEHPEGEPDVVSVLIVNDEPVTLMTLEAVLEDLGLNLVLATSGEEALRQLLARDFAVILLDVMMPQLDGFATAELIRSRPRSATTPIIFVSAAAQTYGEQFKGYELGAVDYLLTPVMPHVLRAKVSVFASLHRKNRQLERQAEELAAAHRQLQRERVAELARINGELLAEIAERRQAETQAHFLATRDALTGLFNRRALQDRLDHAIEASHRHRSSFALLFLDLDHFKPINDGLGHDVGDGLLKEIANRLHGTVRESDTVARLGGDEFVVLLEDLDDPQRASEVADKLIEVIAQPCTVQGHVLNTSASVGVAVFPQDGGNPVELMKSADLAMYQAKQHGRGNWQYFSAELNARVTERHQLEHDLRHAMERGELQLHYQPELEIATGRIVGVEALLRWIHPTRGIVPNEICIPVAEETGLIVPIGRWIIDEACAQMRRWIDAGVPPGSLTMAINASVPQFFSGLTKVVAEALRQHGIDACCLQIEITETVLAKNMAHFSAELARLGAMGVQIAIDDFGTGYSSLALLKSLPIDLLKIDKSFVHDLRGDPDDTAIVEAIIGMAHALKLTVIAEGVESAAQLETLKALGCDEYQGFLTSLPLP
ncbi:MAG: putative bifunctional diguanylate cyclase/phosphodiesterase, partial [Leptothrix sp. (in: b-proteobacteria)]